MLIWTVSTLCGFACAYMGGKLCVLESGSFIHSLVDVSVSVGFFKRISFHFFGRLN